MTSIRVIRDTAIPPLSSREEVVREYGEEAANAEPLTDRVIDNVKIGFGRVALFPHPELGHPYYVLPEDYEVVSG